MDSKVFPYHRTPTAGVNFINILRAAFTSADPKSAKKTVKLSSFFALLGYASVKAASKMLVKLTPGDIWVVEKKSVNP